METVITAIQKTPIPTILILAGLLFMLLAFVTKLGGFIEVSADQKKLAIPIGLLVLVIGLVLTFMPANNSNLSVQPAKSESTQENPPDAIKSTSTISKEFNIMKYGGIAGTQQSPPLDKEVDFETTGELRMKFELNANACSQIRLNIFLDGNLVKQTDFFGESTEILDMGPVSSGLHTLKLSPEGTVGGCNSGYLESWGGKLTLYISG